MLEEIPVFPFRSVDNFRVSDIIQFPGGVAQLGARLAKMDVADLGGSQ